MSKDRTSVFNRLKRLFSSSGFPLEDYLSEIAATVMERHPAEFTGWLRSLRVLKIDRPIRATVETQHHCRSSEEDETPEKYPDFLIRIEDEKEEQVIFVESKVGSDLSGDDQLQVYARILSRMSAAHHTLLFITRDYNPQDPAHVLALVPSGRPKPEFAQTRWFHFAQYFSRKDSSARTDPLFIDLLQFMKSEQLTQNHQFTPHDIAALIGFQRAYSVMRAVIDNDLRDRLSKVCGELMDDWDTDVQAIRAPMLTLRNRLRTRNIGINLGFWLGAHDEGYPWIFGDISFDAKSIGKERIVEAMKEFAASSQNQWFIEDVSVNSALGRIMRGQSLSAFLGEPNHAAAIKTFLIGVIDEIAQFKERYPEIAWTRQQ